MNQDDPFATPDLEKTIIMPSPGGRNPLRNETTQSWSKKSDTQFTESDSIEAEEFIELPGLNPLIAAANPLLNCVPQLRMSAQHPDPSGLRNQLVQRIKSFENQARTLGIPSEKIIAARYAICTLIDESIASTPWGGGEWGKHSLLVTFHNEAFGGEKFFQLLAKLMENIKANRDLIELLYVCLILGFEGRYRIIENGQSKLEALREKVSLAINKERGAFERDLSPHWQASSFKPTKIFLLLPLWILSALCGVALLATYLSFNFLLNNASDSVFSQIQAIQTQNSVLKPLPITTGDPLFAEFLQKEIQEGLVSVRKENGRSIVTLIGDGIFLPGSTVVSKNFVAVLTRIAEALKTVTGQVQIIGHTDNQPIRSARFPSNWHLSQERARSVMQLFIQNGVTANRLNAIGRADAEPIASNNSPEGRARNRRVEISIVGLQSIQ
ncbi:MAG: DotU family type VI secretion system protein [Nitrosomonas sp.]|nr:DotU family type VI secretion system protein [Nitrosomonas sp.]MBK7365820.1 DotU family type VI secretion system protein [Nitrosomonas sp.]